MWSAMMAEADTAASRLLAGRRYRVLSVEHHHECIFAAPI